jgi:CubicO group peptidase (beta-lactamase class C family)
MRLVHPWILPALAAALPLLGQADLDQVVERTRKAFNVPGIAVAVVKDGKVVLAKGYGVREVGRPEPVSERTLFGIASNTKIFTAAALAMLVDEGKLAWDDRVVDRLPGFQMSDPYVTKEMRIRDLLCHRSGLGLGGGDLMFFPGTDLSTAEIVRRLRFVPLASSFRSAYAYDNLLYNVAGEVLREVSGKPWAEFIRERFFTPLGMASSRTSVLQVKPGEDMATPHAPADGKLVALPAEALDNSAAAGAIVSSVTDLTRWVQVLLDQGDLGGGKRLFSAARAKELWTPLTLMPAREPDPALAETRAHFVTYAMGEQIQDYRGQLMVWHTGGLAGQVSRVTMLPEHKLGVIVLTNQESSAAFMAITNTVLDHYLGAPAKDWVGAYRAVTTAQEAKNAAAVAKAAGSRAKDSKPALALASYAGRYRDPWYGDVLVEAADGRLAIRFSHSPDLAGTLEHWQYDTFVARWKNRTLDADAYVTFTLGPDGKVAQVRMKAVSPATDFSYDFHDLLLTPVAPGTPAY